MRKMILLFVFFSFVIVSGACEAPVPISDTYRVTFETGDGETLPSVRVLRDETMTLPIPENEGHTFSGWYRDSDYQMPFTESDLVNEPLTLYAAWTVQTFTIHFNTRGGEDIPPLELPYGSALALPEAVHETAVFGGWFVDEALFSRFTQSSMPAENLYLYARWLGDNAAGYDFLAQTPSSDLDDVMALANYLDYMLFNRFTEQSVSLLFAFDDLDHILDVAFEARHIQANVSLSFSYNPNTSILDIMATYGEEAIMSASEAPAYPLIPFYQPPFVSERDETFDTFEIDFETKTYPVVTTDQLYFVMEKGYRPIFEVPDTPAERAYRQAREVLRTIIDDSMTDVEKLQAMYAWLIEHVTYDGALLDKLILGETDLNRYKGFYLEGVFDDGRAVCDGYSKAMVVFGRMEGLDIVRVVGRPADPTNTVLHAWNKVLLGETWHIIDATSGNTLLIGVEETREMFSHAFFLIDQETMENHYIATSHLDVFAEGGIDVYSLLTYELEGETYTRLIESQEDLNRAFRYAAMFEDMNMTFDVRLAFDYDDDLSQAIQSAMAAAGFGSVRFNLLGDVLVFSQS